MGNLSSGCGCANERMSCGNNNNTDFCSIIWILLLLSVFCGGNSGMNLFGGNGCGCDDSCGNNSCLWIILLLLFCGNGSCGLFGGNSTNNSGCGCGCGCASSWNNGCNDSCGC